MAKLQEFISTYDSEILYKIGNEINIARLVDSFFCRIRIIGKGLKDLVFNFPYLFTVTDLEQGSIIGVSSDTESSELRKKIERFIILNTLVQNYALSVQGLSC